MVEQFSNSEIYPNWGTYSWSTEDILKPEIIEEFKKMSDSRSYAVEYLGQFIDDQSGKAFYAFDQDMHVKNVQFNKELPIWVSMDFNVELMIAELSQQTGDRLLNVFDE